MMKLVAMSAKYLNVRLEPDITYMSFNTLINNKQQNLSYEFLILLKVYLTTTYQDIQIVISVDQLQLDDTNSALMLLFQNQESMFVHRF